MKKLLLILFLTFSLPICADSHLVIEMRNSKRHIYSLDEKPTLKFNDDKLVVETSDINTSYHLDEVLKYHFTEEATDIKDTAEETACIRFTYTDKDCLHISGLSGEEQIRIHDIYGKTIPAETVNDGNTTSVMLNGLDKGIYIISVNGKHTIKIHR